MKIVDDHEVSTPEKSTRFICGAILGALVSIAVIYKLDLSSTGAILVTVVASILGCGVLALIHGDRFWYALFGADRY
jgi:hypothetical protein